MRDNLSEVILPTAAVIVTIAILIWLILRIRTYFRAGGDVQVTEEQILDDFREIRRQGDLSDTEFRSIKGQLLPHTEGIVRKEPPGKATDDV